MALNSPAKFTRQDILEVLTRAISEAIEIDVATFIVKEDLEQNLSQQIIQPENLVSPQNSSGHFRTKINLVDRTIDHEIDLKSIDNYGYRELQRWHIEQVNRRKKAVIKNLGSLEQMRQGFLDHDSCS